MLLHPPRRPWLQPLSPGRPARHQHLRPKLPPHLATLRHHLQLHPLYRRIRSHRLHPWLGHSHPHHRHHRRSHRSHQQHQLSILRLVLLPGQRRVPAGRGDRPHPRRTPLHPLLQQLRQRDRRPCTRRLGAPLRRRIPPHLHRPQPLLQQIHPILFLLLQQLGRPDIHGRHAHGQHRQHVKPTGGLLLLQRKSRRRTRHRRDDQSARHPYLHTPPHSAYLGSLGAH